jgi:hypothetical protein
MADAGADQYTFHLETTSDDEVEGLCRKVREFHAVNPRFLLVADFGVGDPDPHLSGPPGSGSIGKRYGSGSGS